MDDKGVYQVYVLQKKFINTVQKYHIELHYKKLAVFLLLKNVIPQVEVSV